MSGLTAWWAHADAFRSSVIFVLSLVAAASVASLAVALRQLWTKKTTGANETPESEIAAKDKEITELKASVEDLTSWEGRNRITQEVLNERLRRAANMSPEEQKQRDEQWKKEREENKRKQPPPNLTTEIVLNSISFLKRVPTKIPIKIVATQEYVEWAKQLANVFRNSGYEIMSGQEAIDGIFPAKVEHRQLLIRYSALDKRERDEIDKLTLDDPASRQYFDKLHRYQDCLNVALSPALLGFSPIEFPSSDGIDYIRIEIKGAP